MKCLRASVVEVLADLGPHRVGASASMAGRSNSRPITDAGSTVARSARARLSSRASSSALIVGGTMISP